MHVTENEIMAIGLKQAHGEINERGLADVACGSMCFIKKNSIPRLYSLKTLNGHITQRAVVLTTDQLNIQSLNQLNDYEGIFLAGY